MTIKESKHLETHKTLYTTNYHSVRVINTNINMYLRSYSRIIEQLEMYTYIEPKINETLGPTKCTGYFIILIVIVSYI